MRHQKPLRSTGAPARAAQPAPGPKPQVETKGNETITTLSNAEIEEVDITSIRERDGGETEPAVDFADLEEQAAIGPKVRTYIVTRGGRVQTQTNGQRTLVHAGKPLDDLNFDIALMRRQGIEFEETNLDQTG